MGMSVGSGGGDGAPMMEMNTTPLIDVMLVLIIMLIVTLPVMTHAVKLDMPQTNNPPPLVPPVVINIMIDYDNSISWNGTPVPNLATLERYFKVESQKDPQPQVAIEAHPRSLYDTVEQVLASAQRNSMEKMGIIGTDKFQ